MKKAYFQYYETFENILEKIKDVEEREFMRKTIINYGLYGTEPAGLTELEDMAWTVCKDLIDQQLHRREVNAANRAKRQDQKIEMPEKPKAEKKKFTKPTIEEVKKYCSEKNYNINVEAFYSYYESNGWKIGGRAVMKSWPAAVQSWFARDKSSTKNKGTMWAAGSSDTQTKVYEDLF